MLRYMLVVLLAGLTVDAFSRTIPVSSGGNLASAIAGASGGDTVLVGAGTYDGFDLQNRRFSSGAPLIIKAAPGTRPVLTTSSWYLIKLTNCSYIAIDGLVTDGGGQPVYCTDVDHIIVANMEVRNTGQEAVHFRGTSSYIDILRCHIHHTGSSAPQWAEGIYLGSGNTPFMNTDYVWMEGCEIDNTGNSEALNIKPQSYHITFRNNVIHDIAPGTATQYNQAALSLEALDYSFRPGVDPDIWLEGNEIYNVRYGAWANGMQLTSMGARVKNNHIRDCEQNGIFFNNYVAGSSPFTNYLYNNTLEGCAQGNYNTTSTLPISYTDPGTNPNSPQDWYRADTTTVPPPDSLPVYTDNAVPVPGIAWSGGTAATEVSTGANEGTKCIDKPFAITGGWDGFAFGFNGGASTIDLTGYDWIRMAARSTNVAVTGKIRLNYTDTTKNSTGSFNNSFSAGTNWTVSVISLPITVWRSGIKSLQIDLGGAESTSGHIYIDAIYALKPGSLGVPVPPIRAPTVPQNGPALFTLYNIKGQVVRTFKGMFDGNAGHVRFAEIERTLPNGIYFLQVPGQAGLQRMVLVR